MGGRAAVGDHSRQPMRCSDGLVCVGQGVLASGVHYDITDGNRALESVSADLLQQKSSAGDTTTPLQNPHHGHAASVPDSGVHARAFSTVQPEKGPISALRTTIRRGRTGNGRGSVP